MPEEAVFQIQNPEARSQKPEELLFSCPQAFVDVEALEALDMWAWAERGFLPRAGGVDDQLNKDLEILAIISEEKRMQAEKDRP